MTVGHNKKGGPTAPLSEKFCDARECCGCGGVERGEGASTCAWAPYLPPVVQFQSELVRGIARTRHAIPSTYKSQ